MLVAHNPPHPPFKLPAEALHLCKLRSRRAIHVQGGCPQQGRMEHCLCWQGHQIPYRRNVRGDGRGFGEWGTCLQALLPPFLACTRMATPPAFTIKPNTTHTREDMLARSSDCKVTKALPALPMALTDPGLPTCSTSPHMMGLCKSPWSHQPAAALPVGGQRCPAGLGSQL